MQNKSDLYVGVDIGGTFTDLVFVKSDGSLSRRKVPTTPGDYAQGIVKGIFGFCEDENIDPRSVKEIAHATTVATNAILERKGVKTALITTEGFRDVLELRRIRIPLSYDLGWKKPLPLVERALRFTVPERIDAAGNVLKPLASASLNPIFKAIEAEGVEAVAVCLLHAYRDARHEKMIGELLAKRFPSMHVSLSHEIISEVLEFERTSTTVVNAYVAPIIAKYLQALSDKLRKAKIGAPILVMQSNGGLIYSSTAAKRPVTIIESGPAAGVVAAAEIAKKSGYANVITLDMGGTTTKASIIQDGALLRANEYEVGSEISVSSKLVRGGGYLLRMPVVDISEVGAGGGSLASLDHGGALRVGPRSAGAVPGPACYGKGNLKPTVTDANLVLGYLGSGSLAGGSLSVRVDLAEAAVRTKIAEPTGMSLLEAAYGIYVVANSNMVRAIKSVSVERGRDPADFVMMAFGGAGPIHAAALAQLLGIKEVVIPPASGVFSAFGLVGAGIEHHTSRSVVVVTEKVDFARLNKQFEEMCDEVSFKSLTDTKIAYRAAVDLRYRGQSLELTVPLQDSKLTPEILRKAEADFEMEYEKTYGYRSPVKNFELVTLRLIAAAPRNLPHGKQWDVARTASGTAERLCYFGPEIGSLRTKVLIRSDIKGKTIDGPAVIQEYDTTVVVPPGCRVMLDDNSNIRIVIVSFAETASRGRPKLEVGARQKTPAARSV